MKFSFLKKGIKAPIKNKIAVIVDKNEMISEKKVAELCVKVKGVSEESNHMKTL